MKRCLATLAIIASGCAIAADIPRYSPKDSRIRYATYTPDDVVVINVRRGVVTRVILGHDERIITSGTGFSSQCDKDELEWCIRADRDTNQIWVKPREKATHNNLELHTTHRDYSIKFKVLPDAPAKVGPRDEMYRVIMQYPVPPIQLPVALLGPATTAATSASALDEPNRVAIRLAAKPTVRNASYSMETIGGGELIAPTVAFDDGRFTYLRFPNNREIPAPFYIGADRAEARVNFHIEGDVMVIHRVAPRLVLRLGEAVVGIWNDAYDPDGVATPQATVAPSVIREVKKQ